MQSYVAEIAGKDSVAALHKFIREEHPDRIIPTIVMTRTEYGGFESYYSSIDFLKKYAEQFHVEFLEPQILYNEKLWNILCVRYQYPIFRRFGFHTPCIMCHLFTHLIRIEELIKTRSFGIITGERLSHSGRLKVNQCLMTINTFSNILGSHGIKMVQPLLHISETEIINSEIGNPDIVFHANDTKCILSGNLQGFTLEDPICEKQLELFLLKFVEPVGNFVADVFVKGKPLLLDELNAFIEEILD